MGLFFTLPVGPTSTYIRATLRDPIAGFASASGAGFRLTHGQPTLGQEQSPVKAGIVFLEPVSQEVGQHVALSITHKDDIGCTAMDDFTVTYLHSRLDEVSPCQHVALLYWVK